MNTTRHAALVRPATTLIAVQWPSTMSRTLSDERADAVIVLQTSMLLTYSRDLPTSMKEAIDKFRVQLGAAIDSVEFVKRALDRPVPETSCGCYHLIDGDSNKRPEYRTGCRCAAEERHDLAPRYVGHRTSSHPPRRRRRSVYRRFSLPQEGRQVFGTHLNRPESACLAACG
jgi:hypothetical protein